MTDELPTVKKRRIATDSVGEEVVEGAFGKEFQILQGYRDFENEVIQDRAAVSRTGDISVAMQRLKEVNLLFRKAGDLDLNINSLYAQDSHAVMNVSELASISVRNLKLTDAGKVLKVDDIINSAKRYMLVDFFSELRGEAQSVPTDNDNEEQEQDEENAGDEGDEGVNAGVDSTSNHQFKQNKLRSAFLKQFEVYDDFNQFNWFRMGALFQHLSKSPTVVDHMLGPLAVQKKQRVASQRRPAENIGEKITADTVTKETLSVNQEETTPEQVKKCFKVLLEKNGYNQISLFKFIIDPNSYSRSIEHLFYTSFLIKEGRLVLEDDENGYPAIRPKEPLPTDPKEREIERQRRSDASQKHLIFQMDMPTWKVLIKKFKITDSFLA
ncbi:Smc5-Smc6 complex subunit NSE4 Ecym_5634 [Eremothecium cymbalariae DBVPG|uniref:Non-structural maintenance of chromosomes element 4 n=1 Tax=Eremothecium cymbalariae (strain CBS 270.75 / DBVPG 7215 / KCTC 17166 / NRRL Y-17582) TaxID=931890 RepID=I6NE78_ERECY|nr:hypothetical protein Ecym_5634 [Eremothecium cymbalariae DBVPG\